MKEAKTTVKSSVYSGFSILQLNCMALLYDNLQADKHPLTKTLRWSAILITYITRMLPVTLSVNSRTPDHDSDSKQFSHVTQY